MAGGGTGDGPLGKGVWGRTAPSSHAQRFPPCQAYPLRVAPLWLHGRLHPQGHDAGLDRLVASPPSYPPVLSVLSVQAAEAGPPGMGAAPGQGLLTAFTPLAQTAALSFQSRSLAWSRRPSAIWQIG